MSTEDKTSRTEQATPKKRDEAFREGRFAKSADVGVVFVLITSFVTLVFVSKNAAASVGRMAYELFDNIGGIEITEGNVVTLLFSKVQDAFLIVFPILASCFVAALLAGGLQSGFKLTPKVLEPKFSKLNPVNGFKNTFSSKNFVRGVGDLIKFLLVGIIIYGAIKEITTHDIFGSPISISYIGTFILEAFLKMLIRLILALGIIAIINYLYQKHKTNKDIMMTKREVRDERKNQEGDPTVKSALRSMARRMLRRQMLKEVPYADVVVTNPTHYAVALKYEHGKDLAPVVLAKGENLFAKRIKRIAEENGVPMLENKPVARVLFKISDVGKEIPPNLYQVIAEILSEVYKTHKYYFHKLKIRRQFRESER